MALRGQIIREYYSVKWLLKSGQTQTDVQRGDHIKPLHNALIVFAAMCLTGSDLSHY